MQGLINLSDYYGIFSNPEMAAIVLALLTVAAGIIVAKLTSRAFIYLTKRFSLMSEGTSKSFVYFIELFFIVLAIIVSLNILNVNAAQLIVQGIISAVPNAVVLCLLLLFGYIVINLLMEIVKTMADRIGIKGSLSEIGISTGIVDVAFSFTKIFLFLVVISISFNFVGFAIPFINEILLAVLLSLVVLLAAFAYYVLKVPAMNLFSGAILERVVLKPGQRVIVGEDEGEIIGITNTSTIIRQASGYNLMIPNSIVLNSKIYLKRSRQDISKLEQLRARFTTQDKSYCGPACATMMLSFFGFETTQQKVGKVAGTRVPGGTGPRKLVEAVRKVSNNMVRGALIDYDKISDLKEEVRAWISEGALVILWFHKPVVFPNVGSRGHYVLCVGVEDDELIIMDPSSETAGVYLIDYRLIQEGMMGTDKKRGYLVFAKKGSSAYWRVTEGLIYADASAYEELGKSFERNLRKMIRQSATINNLLSEHVFKNLRSKYKGTKQIWKPEEKPKKN